MTITTPILGWFFICLVRLDIASLCTKFDSSSLSRSLDYGIGWVCNYQLMRIFIFCSNGFPYVLAPAFSNPAISTSAVFSCNFHSCIFHSRILRLWFLQWSHCIGVDPGRFLVPAFTKFWSTSLNLEPSRKFDRKINSNFQRDFVFHSLQSLLPRKVGLGFGTGGKLGRFRSTCSSPFLRPFAAYSVRIKFR